jgi:hypothetical protein
LKTSCALNVKEENLAFLVTDIVSYTISTALVTQSMEERKKREKGVFQDYTQAFVWKM